MLPQLFPVIIQYPNNEIIIRKNTYEKKNRTETRNTQILSETKIITIGKLAQRSVVYEV